MAKQTRSQAAAAAAAAGDGAPGAVPGGGAALGGGAVPGGDAPPPGVAPGAGAGATGAVPGVAGAAVVGALPPAGAPGVPPVASAAFGVSRIQQEPNLDIQPRSEMILPAVAEDLRAMRNKNAARIAAETDAAADATADTVGGAPRRGCSTKSYNQRPAYSVVRARLHLWTRAI